MTVLVSHALTAKQVDDAVSAAFKKVMGFCPISDMGVEVELSQSEEQAWQIVEMCRDGMTAQEISAALNISVATIGTRMKLIGQSFKEIRDARRAANA